MGWRGGTGLVAVERLLTNSLNNPSAGKAGGGLPRPVSLTVNGAYRIGGTYTHPPGSGFTSPTRKPGGRGHVSQGFRSGSPDLLASRKPPHARYASASPNTRKLHIEAK